MEFNILLILCTIVALANVILSGIYFFIVKSIWRYIKLTYVISNLYMLILLIQAQLKEIPIGHTQMFLGLLVLLTAMFSGLIVSYSKIYLTKCLYKKSDHTIIE